MHIIGKIVSIKTLQETYFKDYHKMFSKTVRKALGLPEKVKLQDTINFLTKAKKDSQHKNFFCIFDNATNKLIGSIVIRTEDHPRGQFGCWMNENYWGEGRYQEALKLVLIQHFKTHESIFAFVKTINQRSLNAHQKAGFIIQEQFVKNGYDYYKIYLSKEDFLLKSNP